MGRRETVSRGFTLIELMVVVAIIGVLTTVASFYMRSGTGTADTMHRVSLMSQEASRRAVSLGPLPPAILTNPGEQLWGTSRTSLVFQVDLTSKLMYAALEVRTPHPSIGDRSIWQEQRRMYMPRGIEVEFVAPGAQTLPNQDKDAPTLPFRILCNPGGTCDSWTLYFDNHQRPADKGRLAIMFMRGMTFAEGRW